MSCLPMLGPEVRAIEGVRACAVRLGANLLDSHTLLEKNEPTSPYAGTSRVDDRFRANRTVAFTTNHLRDWP
jgi:hypothetical protein